jgi:hypothetical protein
MSYRDLTWQCKWSPYRHVGVFPEQAMHWDWMREVLRTSMKNEGVKTPFLKGEKNSDKNKGDLSDNNKNKSSILRKASDTSFKKEVSEFKILNLFAYTGIASIACAKE